MYYKSNKNSSKYAIIIIATIFLVIIIGIISYLVSTSIKKEKENKTMVKSIKPELKYNLSSTEPNQEKVKITVTATTSQEGVGIDKIILPNQFEVKGDVGEFLVEENGNYLFGVYSTDGQYNSINVEIGNIIVRTADNPYIPEGFQKVEGEPQNGMVIADKNGNEFVWVPVPTGRMTRDKQANPSYRDDSDISNQINNSVAKYKGFYIGRYESSKKSLGDTATPYIVKGKMPWVNIKYIEAKKAAEQMAQVEGYQGYNTSLPSSATWYTVVKWIDEVTGLNYSSSTDKGNYSGELKNTGETQTDIMNNICDLAGNVKEWITETYSDRSVQAETVRNEEIDQNIFYRTLRGGTANISNTPLKVSSASEEDSDPLWGFRVVLYKE